MSGSFGSGGLGSFTVFPVELTCDFAGDSTVTEAATLVAQGTVSFAGDSTAALEAVMQLSLSAAIAGDSTANFTVVAEVDITSSMSGTSALSANIAIVDVDTLTFAGDSMLFIDNTKIFVTPRAPAVLVGTAKPVAAPAIRINPPAIVTHTPSIGGARRRSSTDKKPR
jgi:hypothetical protein